MKVFLMAVLRHSRSAIVALCFLAFFWLSVRADGYVTAPVNIPDYQVIGQREGYLFIAPINFGNCSKDNYLLILDGKGELVYYKALPDCQFVTDFKPQPDGTLSYWTGYQLIPGVFYGELVRMDNTYRQVSIITETNLLLDGHEYLVMPNGHQMVMYGKVVPVQREASTIPSIPARMVAIILRELDQEGNTVWQWNSEDYIPLDDADDLYLAEELSDYMHTNAIDIDTDGNVLISSRHLNEITKINKATGEIVWRMGGKRNQFTLTNDTRWFSHQHDIRRLPNGNISLFDNGNNLLPAYSRYVEYAVDETSKTMTKTWEIRHSPDVYGMAMGNAQRLANGNVLIGWGASSAPAVTEYDESKTAVFELNLPAGKFNYRAYGASWTGQPALKPTAVITDGALHYSWNGSTEVSGYRIYAGSAAADRLLEEKAKTGFEDSTPLRSSLCVYRVAFLDRKADVLAMSDNVTNPECNLLYFPEIRSSR